MVGGRGWGHCGIGASSLRPSAHIQSQVPRDGTSRPLPWPRAASPVLLAGGWLPGPGTQGPAAGQASLKVPGGWTGRRAEEGQIGGERRKSLATPAGSHRPLRSHALCRATPPRGTTPHRGATPL